MRVPTSIIVFFFNLFASPHSPVIHFKAFLLFMLTWPQLSPVLCISLYFKLALCTLHSLTYQMFLCVYPLLLMTSPYCLHLACLDRELLYFRMVVLVLTLCDRSTASPKSLKLPRFVVCFWFFFLFSFFPSEVYVTSSMYIILSHHLPPTSIWLGNVTPLPSACLPWQCQHYPDAAEEKEEDTWETPQCQGLPTSVQLMAISGYFW